MKRNIPAGKRGQLNRAEFLKLLSGAGLAGWLSVRPAWAAAARETPADSLEQLFADSLGFDGNVNLGVKSDTISPLIPGEIKRITGLNTGNYSVRTSILEERNRWIAEHRDALLRVDRFSDIETALRSNRYAVIYYIQSRFDLAGSVEPLARWKELGLRTLQITYDDSELGGGSGSDQLPLTPLGKRVVQELNRLRMVVDVSHCGRRTTLDVTETSSAPVTANHANAEQLAPHARNKSDEELRAIARTGGVIGVTIINRFLLRDTSRPATLENFVEQIEYLVETVGIDHVGLSSDSYMDGRQRYEVDYSDARLCSPQRWKHVVRRLQEKGYSRLALEKIMGGNFRRVYQQVLDP